MVKKKILICGATGFIGRNLCESLSRDNSLEVLGVSHNKPPFDCASMKWIKADLTQKNDVEKLSIVGWSDEDIADIVHETALFNYMNRIVIGLGVKIHPFMERIEKRDKEFLDTSQW